MQTVQTSPQKRTISVYPLIMRGRKQVNKNLKFHLYFPSFIFQLKDWSFFAYAQFHPIPSENTEFYSDRRLSINGYVLPFHKNWSIVEKTMCISHVPFSLNDNDNLMVEKFIDYFWQSDFLTDTRFLGCLKVWQKYKTISWAEIYHLFAEREYILTNRRTPGWSYNVLHIA